MATAATIEVLGTTLRGAGGATVLPALLHDDFQAGATHALRLDSLRVLPAP